MASPTISVVVPCYNYGRFLAECLESIFEQAGNHDFEVVVIDDASTDNTAEVLMAFRDPRLRVLRHSRNRGHGFTIGHGIAESRGDLIARIDPDDRYRPGFLSTVVPRFDAHSEIGLVYGDAAMIDERGNITLERCDSIHAGHDWSGNELLGLLEHNHICAPTAIARREAWQSALPVPDWLAFNDWYFNLIMALKYDFYYTSQVLAEYRVHSTNHHTRIVRDRSEEPSTFRLLAEIASRPELASRFGSRMRPVVRRARGVQYLTLADKYFGVGMYVDARRCYLAALWHRPAYLKDASVLRRLGATALGSHRYENAKRITKAALASLRQTMAR